MKNRPIANALIHLAMIATLAAIPAQAAVVSIPIVNGDFETGTAGSSIIDGWTLTSTGGDGFWLADVGKSPAIDPPAAHGGALFLATNRLTAVPSAGTQPVQSTLSQTVGLLPASAEIATGTATFDLSFWYNDADALDGGQLDMTFFDTAGGTLATLSLGDRSSNGTAIPGSASKEWVFRSLTGDVPVGAVSAQIDLLTQRYGGSATNVSFDDFTLTVIPEPSVALLATAAGMALAGRRRRI